MFFVDLGYGGYMIDLEPGGFGNSSLGPPCGYEKHAVIIFEREQK